MRCSHYREHILLHQSSKRSSEHLLVLPRSFRLGWQSFNGKTATELSVSQSNLEEVIGYIENQEEHHQPVTFQDEYRAFLKAYGIKYDERYVWD